MWFGGYADLDEENISSHNRIETSTANAFISTQPQPAFSRLTQQGPLQMGLFDGMKEAFSAPPAMSLDSEHETPID